MKHVSDQPRSHGGARLREFARKERLSGVHPAVSVLRSRPKSRSDLNRKAAEYLQIERGREV